jgi:hypothetical protein
MWIVVVGAGAVLLLVAILGVVVVAAVLEVIRDIETNTRDDHE